MREASRNLSTFSSNIMASPARAKYFSLIPFFIESRLTPKYFVLQMEVYPNAEYLKMQVLRMGGVYEHFIPIKQLIPITKYDYWCAQWMVFFKQHNCIDLDMIYANHVTKEMFVFDKKGSWHDEGVDHDALSLDKTFNETKWYDEFSAHNF